MRRDKFSFRLSEKEIKRLQYLAKLFYLIDCIPKPSMSDALRYMINEEIKSIKEEEEEIKKLKNFYNISFNKF
jgi:hypothetical protein